MKFKLLILNVTHSGVDTVDTPDHQEELIRDKESEILTFIILKIKSSFDS